MLSIASLELQAQLKRNHAGRAITTQTDAKQTGRRRSCRGKRSKSRLGRRLARNPSKNHARKCEIRMVEYIEELDVETHLMCAVATMDQYTIGRTQATTGLARELVTMRRG